MRDYSTKILIVGAGVAGLALRSGFSLTGATVHMIEKKSRSNLVNGSGIALPPNALKGLNDLGLFEKVKKAGHTISHISYRTKKDEPIADCSLSKISDRFGPFLGIPRKKLSDILLSSSQLPIWYETSIASIDKEKLNVVFSNGFTEKYDLVIGADGAESNLRKILYPTSTLSDLGVTCWRFLTQKPSKLKYPVYMFSQSDSIFMLYPVSQEEVYCYAQTKSLTETPKNLENSYNAFLDCAKEFEGFVPEILKDNLIKERLHMGRIKFTQTYYPGTAEIILIGDAAHTFTPILQQGAAQAIEDSLALCGLLKKADKSYLDSKLLLTDFLKLREKRITLTMTESERIAKSISTIPPIHTPREKVAEAGLKDIFLCWTHLFSSKNLQMKSEDKSINSSDVHLKEKYHPRNKLSFFEAKQEGDARMIELKIKYFLNESGSKYFPEWYKELLSVISIQEGFIGMKTEKEADGLPVIYLTFKNQQDLDTWAEKPIHDELFSKIQKYFEKELGVEKNEICESPGLKLKGFGLK